MTKKNIAEFGKLRSDLVGGCVNRPKVLVLAAAAGVAVSMFNAGAAGAQGPPDVTGKKYAAAAAALKSVGFTTKVSTTVGDQLPQDDCVVSSQVMVTPTSSSTSPLVFGPNQFETGKPGIKIVLVSLNCNATLAAAGAPGNSAATPEGKEAKRIQKSVEWERTPEGQAWCVKTQIEQPKIDWSSPEFAGCPAV